MAPRAAQGGDAQGSQAARTCWAYGPGLGTPRFHGGRAEG